MKRDWLWGLVAWLVTMLALAVIFKSYQAVAAAPWLDTPLLILIPMIIGTAVLWVKNRHSLRKIKDSGGEIELMIQLPAAFMKALRIFPLMLGLMILLRLIMSDVDWARDIPFTMVLALFLGLSWTAYPTSPEADAS